MYILLSILFKFYFKRKTEIQNECSDDITVTMKLNFYENICDSCGNFSNKFFSDSFLIVIEIICFNLDHLMLREIPRPVDFVKQVFSIALRN